MRWDDLFADLEQQWDALAAEDRRAEVAERTRAELATVRLLDRLRGGEGHPVRLLTRAGHEVSGELVHLGADFLLLDSAGHEFVVPVEALAAVRGLGVPSVPAEVAGAVRTRLGLGSMLRRVAADRSVVAVVTAGGPPLVGTVQRVGADFLEMVEHPPEEPPRGAAARDGVAVPFGAVMLVRRVLPEPLR